MTQALILAGGLGTRLRDTLGALPKPMAPVRGKPFLEYQLCALRAQGVTDIVLSVGYRAAVICDYFASGARWGVHIRYSQEGQPRGTAGALKLAAPLLEEFFFVLNGDTFTEFPLTALAAFHRQQHALGTLALCAQRDPRAYGAVTLATNGRVIDLREKKAAPPPDEEPVLVSAGMYVLERSVLAAIPSDRAVSLETETFPQLVARGAPLYGLVLPGYFIDIGTAATLAQFERDLATGTVHDFSE